MSIDNSYEQYSCDEIFGPYQRSELPFGYEDGQTISNSEKTVRCWYIENPISKELVKSITLRLGAMSEKEFIIVLKAPNNRQSYNLASFLTLKMAN